LGKMKLLSRIVAFGVLVLSGCARDAVNEFTRSVIAPMPQSISNLRMHHSAQGWVFSEHTFVFAFEAAAGDLERIRASREFHEVRPDRVGDSEVVAAQFALKAAESAGIPSMRFAKYYVCGPKDEPYVYYYFVGDDGRSARYLKMGY